MQFQPREHQQYCIQRMVEEENLGLFLDMGLGKTIITLSAIQELKLQQQGIQRVLVIAPKKVAEMVWLQEAQKWDHVQNLRVIPILGTAAQRKQALAAEGDVYVINRDNVSWLVDFCAEQWPFDMVVCDEFTSFKNHQAKRFKALAKVRPQIKRFVGLTGTPAPNGLMDLWAQLYLLDGGERLGRYITHFRNRYFFPDQRKGPIVYTYKPKRGADKAIYSAIHDICISMRSTDYLELPDCISVTTLVPLHSQAQRIYQQLEKEMFLDLDVASMDISSAMVLTNKLLQVANGAVYGEDRQVTELHDCKIEALLELVEGLVGQPAIVFYHFRHDLMRIKRALAKTKLRIRELISAEDEAAWNQGQVELLLAHPASSAYGLNLQEGGNQIIWFGLDWNWELYQQANKRLHRPGQNQKVIIHHLVAAGTRDVEVMHALEGKGNIQEILFKSLQARMKQVQG